MSAYDDLIDENLEENEIQVLEEIEDEGPSEQVPANDEAEDANKQPVKAKRIIRNPQVRLTAETLKGKRGLTALPSYFERVKFKGKGHEEQDLGVILKTYEYWCHRLFPRHPFDECLAKIEHLGSKRAAATHIKRIRFDLVCDDEPIINDDHDSDTEQIPNSLFDDLLPTSNVQRSDTQMPLPNTQISSIEPPVDISEEQLERMRVNRERAERIRREKLRQTMELAQSSTRENNTLEPEDLVVEQSSNADLADEAMNHMDHDSNNYQEENEISDHFLSDKGEADLVNVTTLMDSSQLCSDNADNNLEENAEAFVSQDIEANSQEQNTPKALPSIKLVNDQQRSTKISSIIDSDEDL